MKQDKPNYWAAFREYHKRNKTLIGMLIEWIEKRKKKWWEYRY